MQCKYAFLFKNHSNTFHDEDKCFTLACSRTFVEMINILNTVQRHGIQKKDIRLKVEGEEVMQFKS